MLNSNPVFGNIKDIDKAKFQAIMDSPLTLKERIALVKYSTKTNHFASKRGKEYSESVKHFKDKAETKPSDIKFLDTKTSTPKQDSFSPNSTMLMERPPSSTRNSSNKRLERYSPMIHTESYLVPPSVRSTKFGSFSSPTYHLSSNQTTNVIYQSPSNNKALRSSRIPIKACSTLKSTSTTTATDENIFYHENICSNSTTVESSPIDSNLELNRTPDLNELDPRLFVDEKVLIDWINSTLQLNISRIEDTSNGAIACQLLDILYPSVVPMHKVNWLAFEPHESAANYKILLVCFKKLNIEHHEMIHEIIAGTHNDNLNFMQWFKIFFEMHSPSIEDLNNYDCYGRRCKGLGGKLTWVASSFERKFNDISVLNRTYESVLDSIGSDEQSFFYERPDDKIYGSKDSTPLNATATPSVPAPAIDNNSNDIVGHNDDNTHSPLKQMESLLEESIEGKTSSTELSSSPISTFMNAASETKSNEIEIKEITKSPLRKDILTPEKEKNAKDINTSSNSKKKKTVVVTTPILKQSNSVGGSTTNHIDSSSSTTTNMMMKDVNETMIKKKEKSIPIQKFIWIVLMIIVALIFQLDKLQDFQYSKYISNYIRTIYPNHPMMEEINNNIKISDLKEFQNPNDIVEEYLKDHDAKNVVVALAITDIQNDIPKQTGDEKEIIHYQTYNKHMIVKQPIQNDLLTSNSYLHFRNDSINVYKNTSTIESLPVSNNFTEEIKEVDNDGTASLLTSKFVSSVEESMHWLKVQLLLVVIGNIFALILIVYTITMLCCLSSSNNQITNLMLHSPNTSIQQQTNMVETNTDVGMAATDTTNRLITRTKTPGKRQSLSNITASTTPYRTRSALKSVMKINNSTNHNLPNHDSNAIDIHPHNTRSSRQSSQSQHQQQGTAKVLSSNREIHHPTSRTLWGITSPGRKNTYLEVPNL